MNNFDINLIFYTASVVLGVVSVLSGAWMVARSFISFRAHINQSLNMDLEVIRVSKIVKPRDENDRQDAWREEIGAMEQLLTAISTIKDNKGFLARMIYDAPYISLEIANSSADDEIIFFISMPKKFRENIEKQIHSFFPNASLEKAPDYTIFSLGSFTAAATLKLKNSYILPVKTYETLEIDPLNSIANALSKLDTEAEGAAIQLILKTAHAGWRSAGRKVAHEMQQGKRLNDVHNKSFAMMIGRGAGDMVHGALNSKNKDGSTFSSSETVQLTPEEQELLKGIEQKSSKAGFEVNIRLVASAVTQERATEILGHLENAFSQYENSDTNCFQVKSRADQKDLAYDFIFRNFNPDQAIILNTEEIASIFHLPISVTEGPRIKWLKSNMAPPPLDIPQDGLTLGYNNYRGVETTIKLGVGDRRRHLYAIGQTGAGKSNFLQEMAKQDAREGRGFCFIDPHGDAIEDILTAIPKERAEDVIVFDPSDVERPFGLNMLEYDENRPEQKTFVINEVLGIFDQLYDLKATGGPMFEQYMRNAMLLIMDDPASGSTLMEISKVLADEDFRRMKLARCKNQIVVDFWTKEAEKAGGEAALANMVPYITSKLTTFISNDMMRPIISQQNSTINMREIMDNKKILLINLSKGKIGEINARLLGMVMVGKILMAGLSRVDMPEDQRVDFYLYLDEFQNVTTNSIAQILSEARKYKLVLILAHQFIAQLKEEISKAVFGNVGSMVAFRVGPEDAEFLEKQFAPVFSANDLVNVDNYNCFAKILVNGALAKPFNMMTYPPTKGSQEIANAIKELSRLKYGRDKNLVNREIMERTKTKIFAE
ncbi:MAG: TraM recognition domain-containing protein [Candidatus Moranbacteria bacterium]|nr:TraM recognition domain-containing protein [Candidatus Moranbacteria bacterium]